MLVQYICTIRMQLMPYIGELRGKDDMSRSGFVDGVECKILLHLHIEGRA